LAKIHPPKQAYKTIRNQTNTYVGVVCRLTMEERVESWKPHLLGFILPIITAAGIMQGGWWALSGFVWAVGLCPVIDYISPKASPTRDQISSKPWDGLLFMHTIAYLSCIVALLWQVELSGFGTPVVLGALSVGVVGGISGIINAHEAGHRKKGSLIWRMSRLNLLMVMYLHFTTEHNHGHHRNYATSKDPASSPEGRSFYTQLLLTLPLQIISAWKTHKDKGKAFIQNPIFHGLIVQIGFLAMLWIYSPVVMYAFAIQALLAIILLEYVNYIEHYGLVREIGGKHTKMHSWEYRGVWSRWTLLELPLHPAHHLKASAPLWELRAQEGAPQLPFGYYTSFWLALIPPLWKGLMRKQIANLE